MPIDHPRSSGQHGRRPDPCAASPSLPRSCSLRGGRSAGTDPRRDHRRRPGRQRGPPARGRPGRGPGQGHRQEAGGRAAPAGRPALAAADLGGLRRRRQDRPGQAGAGRRPQGGPAQGHPPQGPQRGRGHRGRPLLRARRHRPARHPAGGRRRPAQGDHRPGGQHPHPAVHQEGRDRRLAHPRPQAPRGHVRRRAGGALDQERDPAGLPQPGVLRGRGLRDRHRRPALLRRQVAAQADPGRGGRPGRHHPGPQPPQADPRQGQQAAAHGGARPDAGTGLRQRRVGSKGQEGEAQGQAVHGIDPAAVLRRVHHPAAAPRPGLRQGAGQGEHREAQADGVPGRPEDLHHPRAQAAGPGQGGRRQPAVAAVRPQRQPHRGRGQRRPQHRAHPGPLRWPGELQALPGRPGHRAGRQRLPARLLVQGLLPGRRPGEGHLGREGVQLAGQDHHPRPPLLHRLQHALVAGQRRRR